MKFLAKFKRKKEKKSRGFRGLGFKSLKAKLILGFLAVIIFSTVNAVYSSIALKNIESNSANIVEEELPVLLTTEQLQVNISERVSLARAFVLYGYPSYIDRFNALTEESNQLEQELLQSVNSKELDEIVENSKVLEGYIVNGIFGKYDPNDVSVAKESLSTVNTLTDRIVNGYDDLVKERKAIINESGNELVSLSRSSFLVGIIISSIITIVGIIIALFVSNLITKPVKRVQDRMNLIANGDLSNAPLKVETQDEIGQLVHATNQMNEDLKDLVKEIGLVSESVASQSEGLTEVTNEVKDGSIQMASTMQELSSGAETQANTTTELATSMASFTEKIKEANNSGESVYGNSQKVLDLTKEGSNLMHSSIQQMEMVDGIVKDAVLKVKGLDSQSGEIAKLVSVIKDIADQTNLLALNAAIEAARAGEHGKGFAVVADEVRKLAEQVSSSVTDITHIVTSIQSETNSVADSLQGGYKEVENGKNQVVTTGKTFEQISTSMSKMVDGIQLISYNLDEIAKKSDTINGSIEDIAAISEESAAGIEQTAATVQQTGSSMEEVANSTDKLAGLTDKLNKLVSRFTI